MEQGVTNSPESTFPGDSIRQEEVPDCRGFGRAVYIVAVAYNGICMDDASSLY
jgi:hypothetical protein